jgi:hypothetical protein
MDCRWSVRAGDEPFTDTGNNADDPYLVYRLWRIKDTGDYSFVTIA